MSRKPGELDLTRLPPGAVIVPGAELEGPLAEIVRYVVIIPGPYKGACELNDTDGEGGGPCSW